MSEYQLDPAISEDDFRVITRQRLASQTESFQEKWWPRINDENAHGRLMGYTAVWTAMDVAELHTTNRANTMRLDTIEAS